MPVHQEIELKYAADPALTLPLLSRLLGDDGAGTSSHLAVVAGEPVRHELEATYYDTPDLVLARAGLTLRRRTGGDDEGWHLKVPTSAGVRTEVRVPLGAAGDTVPDELEQMVWARTTGRPLVPVATLTTDRTVTRVLDATARVLAEMADDRVSARRLFPLEGAGSAAGLQESWREVEIELVDGDRDLLTGLDQRVREAGLVPSASSSKLARLLDLEAAAPAPRGKRRRRPGGGGSAGGDVLMAHVHAQVEQVRAHDVLVRLDAPDGVHRMRVATRRLRSALTTFRALVERDRVRAVEQELKWLAGELGTVRDAEVMRHRVLAAVRPGDGHGNGDGGGVRDAAEARAAVDAELGRRYDLAHQRLLGVLDGRRYRDLLVALDGLVQQPPVSARAGRKAATTLPRLVARSHRAVRSQVRRATAETDPARREELWHEVRKAAKRARYAAESVSGEFGKDARRYARAMEAVQETLGEHQDSVLVRERLLALASVTTSTSAAFVYGRLHAGEEAAAGDLEADVGRAWRSANRKKLRRWQS